MPLVNVYFSLGSNLQDRLSNITAALEMMDEAFGCHYCALSEIIETPSWGFSGADFLNCAVLYRIPGSTRNALRHCQEILRKCKSIEAALGRHGGPEYDEAGRRIYHSRTIDIDILFYGNAVVQTPELTIPHALIAQRDFVLTPLREIARPSLRKAFPKYFAPRGR